MANFLDNAYMNFILCSVYHITTSVSVIGTVVGSVHRIPCIEQLTCNILNSWHNILNYSLPQGKGVMTTWFLLGKEKKLEESQLLTTLPTTSDSNKSPSPNIVRSRSSSRRSVKRDRPKQAVGPSETIISIDGTAVYKNKSAEDSEQNDSGQRNNGHNNGFLPSVNAWYHPSICVNLVTQN